MIFLTHLAVSLLIGVLVFPNLYLLCLLGGLLPDIDIATSYFGRRFKIIGWVFKHRGFFHTAYAAIFFAAPLALLDYAYALAFLTGYMSHLLLDSLTPKGTKLLWPIANLKGHIRTGSIYDYAIFVVATCVLAAISLQWLWII